MDGSSGIDLSDFEPPPVPEARPTALDQRVSKLGRNGVFRRARVAAIAAVSVVAIGGAVLWAVVAQPPAGPDQASPTRINEPSAVPTESASVADSAYERQFGSSSEFTVSSSVTETVQLALPLEAFLLRTRYEGVGVAQVTFLDGASTFAAQGPSAAAGYDGVTLVGGADAPTIAAVRVDQSGTGQWTLSFAPVSSAPIFSVPASGQSDAVFRYDGPGRTVTFIHGPGASIGQTGGRQQIGIDEVDATTTRVILRTGTSAVTIVAAGSAWSLQ